MPLHELWTERGIQTLAAIETYCRLNRGRLPRVRELELVLGSSAGSWRRICRTAGLVSVMGRITPAGYAFMGEPRRHYVDLDKLESEIHSALARRALRSVRSGMKRPRPGQCALCHGYHGDRGACAGRP